ncbi:MAG TPA: Mur ligase family protein [Telluria sp.]
MKILRQRLLRGANLYARIPCILGLVDIGDLHDAAPSDLAAIADRVHAMVPSMRSRCLAPLPAGADAAALVAHLTVELQCLAGTPAAFCETSGAEGSPTLRRIVCSYQVEHVAQAAFSLAVYLVDALAHGHPFDFATPFEQLLKQSESYRIDPLTAAVLEAAAARDIPATRVTEHEALYQLGWGSRQRRYHPRLPNDTPLMGPWIAQDRQLTRVLLDEAFLPIPPGGTVETLDDALRVARRLGGRVLVMPGDASAGEGGISECATEPEVVAAFAAARGFGRRVVVERLVEGPRYVGAAMPALGLEGMAALCARASTKLGLEEGSVELACDEANDGAPSIIAVKAPAPSPVTAPPIDVETFLDAVGPGRDGRIPVIAVTGTNGKTTTTLMIAHATALAGHRTGLATTHGISVAGQEAIRGDCTGYWSHRAILSAPDVDIAVLETARGGILKRGLAFDKCNVGVVLNVSDDHLGMEGVGTLEELAGVKGLVASCASAAAVLNADDPHCVEMAQRLAPGAELIYFSLDARSRVLREHVEGGGRGVYLDGADIVTARGSRSKVLMAAADIPCTLGARARYNIANSLAAAAALLGAGYSTSDIVAGLGSFVSDARSNPLRTNLFEVRGITVVVDYAHNPAAYAALGEMARAMTTGAVVGVVTSPGDRRDEELLHTGRACATGFDKLVVYESASRGRPYGQAANLIREGALAASHKPGHIEAEYDRVAALRRAFSLCRAGDVLVYCGTEVSALVEALQPTDPEAAQIIASRTA